MAMKITKAKDIKKAGATIFLFGESGTGKTSALKTLPGKTLIFDIEGGTSVLRGSDVDIVSIPHSLAGFKEAIDEICLMEKLPYDNVCLDSLTEVQTCMLVAMANASKTQSPTLQDYGIVQFKIRDYCRRLRDLRETYHLMTGELRPGVTREGRRPQQRPGSPTARAGQPKQAVYR